MMNDVEKKLDALIGALGFDIERTLKEDEWNAAKAVMAENPEAYRGGFGMRPPFRDDYVEIKLVKREFKSKPTLHKLVREYERGDKTASELIGHIMLLEDIDDSDL